MKIRNIIWRLINLLPSKNYFNRLRFLYIDNFYKNITLGKNVLIHRKFSFPSNVLIAIGDNTVIRSNFCLYFDIKSNKYNKHILSIGSDCHVLQDVTIDCSDNVLIGDNVHIGRKTEIFTHNHILNDPNKNIVNTDVEILPVKIGKNVVLYDQVVILPGVEMADGIVVGIRSVVSGKIDKENMVIAGSPARPIKKRF